MMVGFSYGVDGFVHFFCKVWLAFGLTKGSSEGKSRRFVAAASTGFPQWQRHPWVDFP